MDRPKFKYHVPYDDGDARPWYVVVTARGHHFYFNALTKQSYWQLADCEVGEALAARIDFDAVAVLMAKVNGLRVAEEEEAGGDAGEAGPRGEDNEDGGEIEEGEDIDGDDYAKSRDEFIAGLLQEEGYFKQTGLDLGYSSLEESELPAETETAAPELPAAPETAAPETAPELPAPELPAPLPAGDSLNLDVDDLDDPSATSAADFLALLSLLSTHFSPLDPWFIVEQELLPMLIKDPSYFAVPAADREALYDQWCTKNASTATAAAPEFEFATNVPPTYPTGAQLYLQFVLERKPTGFYIDFKRQHRAAIDNFITTHPSLSDTKCETLYRQYTVMLKAFRAQERAAKKANPRLNVKKLHLQRYLATTSAKMPGELARNVTAVLHQPDTDDAKCARLWYLVCSALALPASVAENATNYIVGPRKRVECYLEAFDAR